MKTLNEFIELSLKREGKLGYVMPEKYDGGKRTFEEFLDLNGITENDVKDADVQRYYAMNYSSIIERHHDSYIFNILETLKSHPHNKLVDKINKEFTDKIVNAYVISSKPADALPVVIQVNKLNPFVTNLQVGTSKLSKTKSSDKLYDIIKFFNYYVTSITTSNEVQNGYDIFLEPEYTRLLTDEIKKNGGHLYHVTSIDNIDSIKKTGLRPRVGKTPREDKDKGYRYFVERVFLIGDNKTKEDTIKNIQSVLNDKQLKTGDYVILDIDISNHNIGLWEDGASEGQYNVYTYEAIPPSLIKFVDDIDKL